MFERHLFLLTLCLIIVQPSLYAQPIADVCSAAIPITLDTEGHPCSYKHTFYLDQDGSTNSGMTSSCHIDPSWKDKFFTLTTQTTGIVWYGHYANPVINVYKNLGDASNPICGSEIMCSDINFNSGILKGWSIGDNIIIRISASNYIEICLQEYTILPAPSNNKCSGATPLIVNSDLNCSSMLRDSTKYAERSSLASSCVSPANDVWYSFIAESYSHAIQLSNVLEDYSLAVQVYSGACDVLTELACFSFSYYYNNELMGSGVDGLQPGQKYFVRVMTVSDDPISYNSFEICIGQVPNDLCRNAQIVDLTGGETCIEISDSTYFFGTKSSFQSVCNNSYSQGDIWYRFTAQVNSYELSYSQFSYYNQSIQLFEGECSDLSELYCLDLNYNSNKDIIDLTVGQSYYLRIIGPKDTETQILCIKPNIPTPIDCSNSLSGSICNRQYANEQFGFTAQDPTKKLSFKIISGQLDQCCDVFTIHDGEGITAPVIYSTSLANLIDTTIVSTGPSIYVYYVSPNYSSCETNYLQPILYSVQCESNECPDNLSGSSMLTGDQSTDKTYITKGIIESQQNILSGLNVIYSAKNSIELFPNFMVESNTVLTVDLMGCND